MSYELELAGTNATWVFEAEGIRIRFVGGRRANPLHRALGELVVPNEALSGVIVEPGKRRTDLVLRLRPGADAFGPVLAGRLPEAADPYRLSLPGKQPDLAQYHATQLRDRISLNPRALEPTDGFLVVLPPAPRSIKGLDGEVAFDGETLTFTWGWMAETVKEQLGPQRVPLENISVVEWSPPTALGGFFRITLSDGTGLSARKPDNPAMRGMPDKDPYALAYGLGDGSVADLLFAAELHTRIVAARQRAELLPAEPAVPVSETATIADRADDVVEAIRKLGGLHEAGLLTDEEFSQKKAELLDRL
ncbi:MULTISPECIES: DUF4429 domain-containing protein [Actinoalloteichus]|uniref:DUF4429 domain-containing protein n=1 Tax=Actinoalloteichus TaxID=65496 RepID=UPI00269B4100